MNNAWSPSLNWLLLAAACMAFSCGPVREDGEEKAGRTESIPVSGGVEHVSGPNGLSSTWVSFIVEGDDAASLPEGIETVSVSVNGERLPLSRSSFTYFPGRRLFWASMPGAPEIGDYEIRVTGNHRTGVTTDRLSTIFSIDPPRPDTGSPDATVPCTTNRPRFAWRAAKAGAPMVYRLEIAPAGGRPLYRSGDVRDMLAVTLPDGVLEPGKPYRWRVRASDSDKWREVQNRSQTPWIDFTTAERFVYEYHLPTTYGDGLAVGDLLKADMNPGPVFALCERIINREVENLHSLLLVKDGKLVFEEYFYGYDTEKKHLIASVTKSVVSLLVGIAIDRGFISDVDEKVMDYFPDFISETNTAVWAPIRLHHLLTMSAGLDWDAVSCPREDPRQTTHRMYDSQTPIAFVFQRKAVAEPGRVYNYNSGLTMLLGEIVKRATGGPADRFAREHLFDRLGISDFAWDRFENGVIAADGGLLLRPRDMAKIGLLVLNQGNFSGRQVVSTSWIAESTRTHIAGSGVGYGYQWRRTGAALAGKKIEVVYASGLGGQKIFIVPALKAVAVITSKTHHNHGGGSKAERLFLESILPALMNTDPPVKKIVAPPTGRMEALVGRYEIKATGHAGSVYVKDGRLYLQVPGKGTTELFFTGPDQCCGRIDGLDEFTIQAVVRENGRMDHARLLVGLKSYRLDKIK
ncbi:hypothetical protein DSCA_17220 [Desulfosarcina alkanivorans]|uniref:Beta-lactamase-related domain-containing protein n=1 Tax=Desulfosarcina alkanivorans TaxID=571177 RepID=A0A5K7YE61_9BACT|nr:serine hydrolase [Desulfosarcina alkanivorans]BBO67792.1 hypothetical protein DSCA_17220 [Desulfosarcina alkanivorans]